MHEVELPEAHEHPHHALTIPVSVTISILAVLIAAVTLLGHRANTEQLLLQSQATDQWAYYQAKNIRLHEMQAVSDMLAVLGTQDKEKAEAMRDKYDKEVKRYEADKDSISEKAKELEAERDVLGHRGDRYEGGEVLIEIGLVICSLAILTKRRIFWFSGMAIAAAGMLFAVTGFLVH